MKRILALLILIPLLSHFAYAQKWSIGTNLFYDQTLKDYDDNLDSNPVGVSVIGLHSLKNSRFSVGTEVGVAMYYSSTYSEDLTEQGYPGSVATVYEEDCYFTYNAIVRYNLTASGLVTPYAELKLGGSSYFTSKDYNSFSGFNSPSTLQGEFNVHGTSFKTGLGGGVLMNFGMLRKDRRSSKFSLDLGATVNNGTKTDYRSIRESRVAVLNSANNYNSKTNNIVFRIGGLFTF